MYVIHDENGIPQESEYYYPQGRFRFLRLDKMSDGEIELICVNRYAENLTMGYVPTYMFTIVRLSDHKDVGHISLRVGFNENIYYGGHIGYGVDEPYRGHAYSYKACKLLRPLALRHKFKRLLITTNPDNYPSRRTCEKLGCTLLRQVDVPPYNELYRYGEKQKLIYEWLL